MCHLDQPKHNLTEFKHGTFKSSSKDFNTQPGRVKKHCQPLPLNHLPNLKHLFVQFTNPASIYLAPTAGPAWSYSEHSSSSHIQYYIQKIKRTFTTQNEEHNPTKKLPKDLNRCITTEYIQIKNKHIKMFNNIREMQFDITKVAVE